MSEFAISPSCAAAVSGVCCGPKLYLSNNFRKKSNKDNPGRHVQSHINLCDVGKFGLGVNSEKIRNSFMSNEQNAKKSTENIVNKSVETVEKFKYFGKIEANETYRHE